MYATDDYVSLARWLKQHFARLAGDASAEERKHIEQYFLSSSRYEYVFWDMAYREVQWVI